MRLIHSQFFALLLFALISDKTAAAVSIKSNPYLYADEKGGQSKGVLIVKEHFAPIDDKKKRTDQPSFMYNARDTKYRVIEYYVHWCGTCRQYSRQFKNLAESVKALSASKDEKIEIEFHAVSCVPNKILCRKRNADLFPLIELLKPGETQGVMMRHDEVTPVQVLEKLGIDTTGLRVDPSIEEWDVSSSLIEKERSLWYSTLRYIFGEDSEEEIERMKQDRRRSREDLRNDIHLSFDFLMRYSVFTSDSDELPEEKISALFDWIELLRKTLPPNWTDLQALLESLSRNFRYISKKEDYLTKFLDKYPPKSSEWSDSCSKKQKSQGFTCGLWEIIHATTVGMVAHNKNQLIKSKLLVPAKVAKTIRNFLEFFFQCDECRRHFLAMFDNCGHNHCTRLKKMTKMGLQEAQWDWEQVALFFYEVHNSVNLRLMKERAVREQWEPTRQNIIDAHWPPVEDCRPCWKPDANGNLVWNEMFVIKYLELEYGHRDKSTLEFQQNLAEINAKMQKERQEGEISTKMEQLPSHILSEFMFLNCVVGCLIIVFASRRSKTMKSSCISTRSRFAKAK